MKKIVTLKVDGVKIMQLFINGRFKQECEVSSQFTAKQIKEYFLSL